jgi:hypothetical protein
MSSATARKTCQVLFCKNVGSRILTLVPGTSWRGSHREDARRLGTKRASLSLLRGEEITACQSAKRVGADAHRYLLTW